MKRAATIIMAMVMAIWLLPGETMGQAPPIPEEEQPEVMTRGPVNEAFAQPVNLEEQTGLTVPKAPPAPIEEIPPAERPAGDQFVWVPGYWAWDSDKNDYIWVSGCWRAAPPNMYWMPGYWTQTAEGWRWVPGLWVPVVTKEIEYLPPPPALTTVGPPGPAPSPDTIWVPPCWYWHVGHYIYRAGYWIVPQADWVWVPSHYIWTPRGYIFARGYWDFVLQRRGVLFAPVYFPRHIQRRHKFSYQLRIAVNLGNLNFILFTRPRYCHYYFGDYYDRVYIGIGIFPWFESVRRHTWYDPLYHHARWRHHKREPRWEHHERREYERRRADKTLRPPRTYRELASKVAKVPVSQRNNFEIAAPITSIVKRKMTAFPFEQAKPEARQQISRHADDVHEFSWKRKVWEAEKASRGTGRQLIRRVPSSEVKTTTGTVKQKRSKTKPTEPLQTAPTRRPSRGEGAGHVWQGATKPAEQRKTTTSSPPETKENLFVDKVKARISPVVGKQSGKFLRKRPPSQPDEEEKNLWR